MRVAALLLAGCLALSAAGTASAMIAPWYVAANQAQACLNRDPQVNATTTDLSQSTTSGGYDAGLVVRVAPCGPACSAKAAALSTLMAPWAKARKVSLVVLVGNGATSPLQPGPMPQGRAAADAVASALTGNAIYQSLGSVGGTAPPAGLPGGSGSRVGAQTVVEFAPVVVQYASGDLSDAYGRTSQVAKDACAEVFGLAPAAGPAASAGGRVGQSATGLGATTAKA